MVILYLRCKILLVLAFTMVVWCLFIAICCVLFMIVLCLNIVPTTENKKIIMNLLVFVCSFVCIIYKITHEPLDHLLIIKTVRLQLLCEHP